jgi:uncharacterized protein (DUF58 family)
MPARRCFLVLALASLPLAVGVLAPWLLVVGAVADLGVLAAMFVDVWRARRLAVRLHRVWPAIIVQGVATRLDVEVCNDADRPLVLALRDGLHPALGAAPMRKRLVVPGRERLAWRYRVTPRRRGNHALWPITVRVRGPWGLAWSQRECCVGERVRVYPQVRWSGRTGQLLTLAHRHQLGSIVTRSSGRGSEPYAVRDYRRGDPLRAIHWRASARHGSLVVREETVERSDRLVILLDCGRAMASRAGDRSKLDHSLAAALAVLRVAAARGDRASLIAFSDRIETVVRLRTTADVPRAYAALYDLEARRAEPSFDLAVEHAERMERRRSTVLLITSAVDLGGLELLRDALRRLVRRHRAVLVHLEDPELHRLAVEAPDDVAGAFAKTAALAIAAENRQLTTELRRLGATVVSDAADRLAASSLNAYLSLSSRRS